MIKSKILIISPKYRPAKDGLSDYVFYFQQELKKNFIESEVITSNSKSITQFASQDKYIHPIMDTWDFWGPTKMISFIGTFNPDIVLIEYVPHMYGRAGINICFPFYILFVRYIQRKTVHLMAHELYHPFQFEWKSIILFLFHIWNLFLLTLASHKVFTTTENFVKILKRFPIKTKNLYQLPVGPNISRIDLKTDRTGKKSLILFGGFHLSRNTNMVLEGLNDYFFNHPHSKFVLHIIGSTQPEYSLKNMIFHGSLEELQVSELFSQGHFSLNYFVDGISSRRGSAISALNLGLPIITTFNERSDQLFKNLSMVKIVTDQPSEFNKSLQVVLSNLENLSDNEYEALRLESLEFIDKNFSWDIIIKRYLKTIED